MRNNWIAIYDNTSDGRIVYVSDSITDCTEFEPEEVVGKVAFDVFHPDDNDNVKLVHVQNVSNDRMSSMTSYRHLCKSGHYVQIEVIAIYCFDLMVACNYIVDESSLEHKMRISSADTWYVCIPNGPLQKVSPWRPHQEKSLSRDQVWVNKQLVLPPSQKRVCLILNRFTDDLEIMYASSLAHEVLGLNPVTTLGRSIYDFLPEIDCMSLQTHMDLAKKHDMMFRLRFDWIINDERGVSEQVEGITSCTNDGLVMILRLAPRIILRF